MGIISEILDRTYYLITGFNRNQDYYFYFLRTKIAIGFTLKA